MFLLAVSMPGLKAFVRSHFFASILHPRRCQSRKDAFEQRKRELKALGLGQDGRPIKKQDENKEVKSRGKVYYIWYTVCILVCFSPVTVSFCVWFILRHL